MQPVQSLVVLVGDKQNAVKQAHAAAFEKLEVMHGAGRFVRAEDFAALPVDQDLILDGMAFLLAGIRFLLFFSGRSVGHSVASTMTTAIP